MHKEAFLNAVDTLKLYRRAELADEQGHPLISELYVDPLPNDHVLKTVLKTNTTFLIGRKGTGKSTIFQRAQDILNTKHNSTWAYIDIKTLYEFSTSEIVGDPPAELAAALSPDAAYRLTIFKSFVIELIEEIKKQINLRITSTFWAQVKEVFTGSAAELFEKLDDFVEDLRSDQYVNLTGTFQSTVQTQDTERGTDTTTAHAAVSVKSAPTANLSIVSQLLYELEAKRSQNYSQVFVRIFNIRGLILRLREILASLGVKHLFIFIDDFSELPRADMEQVVDTILAPFNNWSDEFIKLKVAVYPGRLYAGEIDLSKADEVYLDIYRAYGRHDVGDMEERAIDFTRRLLSTRVRHYCDAEPEEYFETGTGDLWRILFYASMGNPRILGYILYYSYEGSIVYGNKIGVRAIQHAVRRYYDEKIDHYFRLKKFLHETFEERSSIYSLRELFEEIVQRAKMLRSYRESKVMFDISGRPPTSHFHVLSEYDRILSTLELNFFLTKYYEMKDRDGREVSVYALNYGLCQQESIAFGRPRERREHRLYFVERIFDYSSILASYIKVNQEIVCDRCPARHSSDALAAIQKFDMLCPECKTGRCRVVNLSRKYEHLIRSVAEENLLPSTELGILKTLHDERKEMFAKEIAAELDCSYQLVGKRGRNLSERDLVVRSENPKGRRVFALSDWAEEVYFTRGGEEEMNF